MSTPATNISLHWPKLTKPVSLKKVTCAFLKNRVKVVEAILFS